MTIKVRVTSKSTAARDKAYKKAFDRRYELKLWGWKKTPKAFATVYQGDVLPSGFKAKMKASPEDKVEVMMPGQRLFSAL